MPIVRSSGSSSRSIATGRWNRIEQVQTFSYDNRRSFSNRVQQPLLSVNDGDEVTLSSSTTSPTTTTTSNSNVESISLDALSDNHEEEGALMALSVAKWLDAEWMPQEIHIQMGHSAKLSYIVCREEGDSEIMSIMMRIATDLEENWALYDKDAFVNAWDVANYVSDYLTNKSGSEGCGCSSRIY